MSRRFRGVTAVDNVSLDVVPGEFFSLLGPSGCGKTTTLRLIAGFETPEEGGAVRMLGADVTQKRPYERPIGMVFQNYALFPHLDVAGNVAFGLEERRVPAADARARVDRALDLVRLDPAVYRQRRPSELSGGQRQRVALARALVLEPPILLLDEPLGALDLQLRKEMQLELRRLNRALGITFILVTHDQEEALVMSDRIAVMSAGRVAQVGTPAEIYLKPKTEFVATFIGEANILRATVGQSRNDGIVATSALGDQWHLSKGTANEGDEIRIAMRPEWLRVVNPDTASSGNRIDGTLTETIFRGESVHGIVTRRDGSIVRIAFPAGTGAAEERALSIGDTVTLEWHGDRAQVLE